MSVGVRPSARHRGVHGIKAKLKMALRGVNSNRLWTPSWKPDMDTNELIQAAAVIAGQLAAQSFNAGNISPGKIQEIARTAVTIAREIESEARRSYG